MTGSAAPLIDLDGVSKHYGEPAPLRIRKLTVSRSDRVALSGLSAAAAETLINLITGASVPDEGTVRIAGRDTRDIRTDTDWLHSLDRFGIVTARAVLIDKLTVADNLALPLTVSIDPISAETRARVEALADRVGLPRARLSARASTLTPEELVRLHLARALAPGPELVLLEHPTAAVADETGRRALGRMLHESTLPGGVGWLAVSDDPVFLGVAGASRLTVGARGDVRRAGFWWRLVP